MFHVFSPEFPSAWVSLRLDCTSETRWQSENCEGGLARRVRCKIRRAIGKVKFPVCGRRRGREDDQPNIECTLHLQDCWQARLSVNRSIEASTPAADGRTRARSRSRAEKQAIGKRHGGRQATWKARRNAYRGENENGNSGRKTE